MGNIIGDDMTLEQAKQILLQASTPKTKEERALILQAIQVVAGSFAVVHG